MSTNMVKAEEPRDYRLQGIYVTTSIPYHVIQLYASLQLQ